MDAERREKIKLIIEATVAPFIDHQTLDAFIKASTVPVVMDDRSESRIAAGSTEWLFYLSTTLVHRYLETVEKSLKGTGYLELQVTFPPEACGHAVVGPDDEVKELLLKAAKDYWAMLSERLKKLEQTANSIFPYVAEEVMAADSESKRLEGRIGKTMNALNAIDCPWSRIMQLIMNGVDMDDKLKDVIRAL